MARVIVLSTCGSLREARKIATDLVRRKLAACVNIHPVSSVYRWKGKIVNDREYITIIKTRSEVFTKVKRRILALHSYQLAEIVSFRINKGHQPYLEWIDSEVLVARRDA